jgi:hypothetical protein
MFCEKVKENNQQQKKNNHQRIPVIPVFKKRRIFFVQVIHHLWLTVRISSLQFSVPVLINSEYFYFGFIFCGDRLR